MQLCTVKQKVPMAIGNMYAIGSHAHSLANYTLYKLYLLLLCTKLCCIYLMLLVERCPVENCGSQRLATASPFNTVCCGTDNALLLRGSYKTRSAQTLARVVWASFAPQTDKKPFVNLFFILFAFCFLSSVPIWMESLVRRVSSRGGWWRWSCYRAEEIGLTQTVRHGERQECGHWAPANHRGWYRRSAQK